MLKIAAVLIALATVASATSSCMPEKVQVMNMAYKNMMLFNRIKDSGVSEAQLEAIYPKVGSCNAVDGAICVGELTAVIFACVAEGFTGVGIAACVGEIVGVANSCYDCICWVMETLGFSC
eukprot:TRINITY_DN1313_c0_g1_i2.p1 TRINITY_DN1313_c0_g1~~TRINITY_DN1313_c0_g1_i2.p1  ORF type:complete len:121 (-),score=34.06 TRINITY_DN1313_c0_g1_i2:180-542(-)